MQKSQSNYYDASNQKDKSDRLPKNDLIIPVTVRMLDYARSVEESLQFDDVNTEIVQMVGKVNLESKDQLNFTDTTGQILIQQQNIDVKCEPEDGQFYKLLVRIRFNKNIKQYLLINHKLIQDSNELTHHLANIISNKLKRTGSMSQSSLEATEIKRESFVGAKFEEESLLEKVWKYAREIQSNIITVYKIHDNFKDLMSMQEAREIMEKLESNGRLEKTRHDTYRLNDY